MLYMFYLREHSHNDYVKWLSERRSSMRLNPCILTEECLRYDHLLYQTPKYWSWSTWPIGHNNTDLDRHPCMVFACSLYRAKGTVSLQFCELINHIRELQVHACSLTSHSNTIQFKFKSIHHRKGFHPLRTTWSFSPLSLSLSALLLSRLRTA